MAKDNPILPTPAGRKQVVVVEEKGWERRNACLPLPAAGTGERQDSNLGGTRTLTALKSLCDAAFDLQRCRQVMAVPAPAHNVRTFCSD